MFLSSAFIEQQNHELSFGSFLKAANIAFAFTLTETFTLYLQKRIQSMRENMERKIISKRINLIYKEKFEIQKECLFQSSIANECSRFVFASSLQCRISLKTPTKQDA